MPLNIILYCISYRLNMFRALLCPKHVEPIRNTIQYNIKWHLVGFYSSFITKLHGPKKKHHIITITYNIKKPPVGLFLPSEQNTPEVDICLSVRYAVYWSCGWTLHCKTNDNQADREQWMEYLDGMKWIHVSVWLSTESVGRRLLDPTERLNVWSVAQQGLNSDRIDLCVSTLIAGKEH